MPDRVVRQDILTSDAVNALSWQAEVFYRRLMSLADDFGRYEARTSLLRASLFPLKLEKVSDSDVVKWLGECSKTGIVRTYTFDNKEYLEILKFGQRLRAMKSKYPAPKSADICQRMSADDSNCPPETKGNESESETESETKGRDTPAGVDRAAAPPTDPIEVFKGLEKTKKSLYQFIAAYKPDFIEPYVELWNFFAAERGKAQISKISNARRKKFKTRIQEKAFDFIGVLTKAGKAGDFLSTSKWFTFDWMLDSESNYLKVLEGNYDPDDKKKPPEEMGVGAKEVEFLYQRYLEDSFNPKLVTEKHCDYLLQEGRIELDERFIQQSVTFRIQQLSGTNQAAELRMIEAYQKGTWPSDADCQADEPNRVRIAKKFALLEFFKQSKSLNRQNITNVIATEKT